MSLSVGENRGLKLTLLVGTPGVQRHPSLHWMPDTAEGRIGGPPGGMPGEAKVVSKSPKIFKSYKHHM
jgi:hypothetical protein